MIIPDKYRWSRWVFGGLTVGVMAGLYVFQRRLFLFDEIGWINEVRYLPFILNRTVRLIVNDSLCLVLFVVAFNGRKELRLAAFIFGLELLVVLPLYFLVKLALEGDIEISSPLLSFIHRLVVNPLLMIMLLIGLLYQKFRIEK